jgi:hypothetical protein
MQLHDLRSILDSTGEHQLTPVEKVRFVSEYAFGDLIGLFTLLGLIPLAARRSPLAILWWCLAMVVVFTAWIPVAYPRYVLMVIPALAIAADYGYRQLIVAAGNFASRRRRSA